MRAFIALELPEEVKKELGKIQQELKNTGIEAKWVKPEQAHLTLAFLGWIEPEKIEVISQIFDDVTRKIKSVKLALHQLDSFSSKVVFVNLKGELGKLNALSIKIRKGLKKTGVSFDEKPFAAHLTVARIKKAKNLRLIMQKIKVNKQIFFGNKISLMKSTLARSGPIYERISEKVLK
jgi:2'-5' RNA ligase